MSAWQQLPEFKTPKPEAWRPLVEKLHARGMLNDYWEATDPERYPQERLLGPDGRALAMAADLIG
jgi:hypothetical protein